MDSRWPGWKWIATHARLTRSLPEPIMETCRVVLTFESQYLLIYLFIYNQYLDRVVYSARAGLRGALFNKNVLKYTEKKEK